MKKQLFLGMVTFLVAIPGFSQIKAEDNKTASFGNNSASFQVDKVNQLPFLNYHGFQLNANQYQPKGFQGVLVPKAQDEKPPAWLKPEASNNNMPRYKPQANQKIKVARPDSEIRYH